jgi:tetratricopeptide (TPR) repeat protein
MRSFLSPLIDRWRIRQGRLAVAAAERSGDELARAQGIRRLGDVYRRGNRTSEAEVCYREAIETYRSNPYSPPLDLANAVRGLAVLTDEVYGFREATTLWEEACELYGSAGIAAGVAECAARLALAAFQAGDIKRSQEWLETASAAAHTCQDAETATFVGEVRDEVSPSS